MQPSACHLLFEPLCMDSRLTVGRHIAEEVHEINTHCGCGSVRHTSRISEKRCGGLADPRIPKRNDHGRAVLDEIREGADDTTRPFSHLANDLWGVGICGAIAVCVSVCGICATKVVLGGGGGEREREREREREGERREEKRRES